MLDAATSVGRYVDGQHYCMVSGLPSSGALTGWFLDVAGHSGEDRYEWLDQAMRGLSREPPGIFVQPYPIGRAAPQPDPDHRLDIRGLNPQHTAAHIARALIEGACLVLRAEHAGSEDTYFP